MPAAVKMEGGAAAAAGAGAGAAVAVAAAAGAPPQQFGAIIKAFKRLLREAPKGMPLGAAQAALVAADFASKDVMSAINTLTSAHEVELMRSASTPGRPGELYVRLVEAGRATKIASLSPEELAVLAIIEKSGNHGVWVRNIKMTTKLQQAQITKMLKKMEG